VNKDIGNRIKRIRESKAIDPKTFADEIGILPTSLSKIEREGSNSVQTLYKIAKILGVRITELFEDKAKANLKETKIDYGYATKEDLAEVVRILTKEIAKLREEIPKKKASNKEAKKYKAKK